MAICIPGPITADVRGSIGNVTFSRNFAGLIAKTRTNPNQPQSAKRDQTQANLTAVSQGWSDRLSSSQRSAWRSYGARYPRPNRWGNPVIDSGYLAFVRCNCSLKMRSAALWVDDPPDLGMYPMPIIQFDVIELMGDYYLSVTDQGVTDPIIDDLLIWSLGKLVNVGVNYYSSPFQFFWWQDWDNVSWEPDLDFEPMPPWIGTGDRLFVRAFRISEPTGRLSVHYQAFADVQQAKGAKHKPEWYASHPRNEWDFTLP